MTLVTPDPHPLLVGDGPLALDLATAERDPGSLGAATRSRARVSSELAAYALEQVTLRTRARTKFGDRAGEFLYTATGLEQASRPEVSRERFAQLDLGGVGAAFDLGCGLGFDALALAEALAADGVDVPVTAVELDPLTASCAAHNLSLVRGGGAPVAVLVGRAEDAAEQVVSESAHPVVFLDPARRTATGRSWRLDDLTPSWDFVLGMRERASMVVKLGPGAPVSSLPDDLRRHWLSHRGSLVELSLSTPGLGTPDLSKPVLAGPDGVAEELVSVLSAAGEVHRLRVSDGGDALPVVAVGRFVHEPDPAVIRARALAAVGHELGATQLGRVADGVAYLTSAEPVVSPFLTSFEVLESLPWAEKTLRAWCREHAIGSLEIKKRGIDLDPAQLRKRLKLTGKAAATVIITPTTSGTRALICRRL